LEGLFQTDFELLNKLGSQNSLEKYKKITERVGLTALARGVNFEILSVFILLVTYEQAREKAITEAFLNFIAR
jgi:hypothetical protein